ncbi:hypothetical protein BH10PAT3_BH10PAT3_4130 [soil metagenome]
MKTNSWLSNATKILDEANIPSARLDTLILLEDLTGKDRSWLLAHPDFNLTRTVLVELENLLGRRAAHEPLAYIRSKSEFYGRTFKVTPTTLQPRSETETMLDMLKLIISKQRGVKSLVIADIGTGSGCIAITAKLEWPEAEVYATEINQDALKVAKQNAANLKADVKFYIGNLLTPLSNAKYQISVILANLPYVPDNHTINQAAMQEPAVAIFGGPDGLDLYRGLFEQISKIATKLQFLLTESLPFQHEALATIAQEYGFRQLDEEDFIQVFKRV